MRKMIISFGFGSEYSGSPEDVLEIANLVDEKLQKVSVSYEEGIEYYQDEDQSSNLNLKVANQVHPYEWYKELKKEKE